MTTTLIGTELRPNPLRYYRNVPAQATLSTPPITGFRRVWRTLKQLFHELIGAIFALLAFAWCNAALRAWHRDATYWLVAIAILVALAFSFFSFTSFRHARKL